MNNNVLYEIIKFLPLEHDYSSLFTCNYYSSLVKTQFLNHQRYVFCEGILEIFSTLFYLNIIAGPPTREEIESLFTALDYTQLFQVPNYYGISVYMNVFKEYSEFVLDNNIDLQPRKKIYKFSRTNTVEALTLC